MMQRDPHVTLRQMLDYARATLTLSTGKERADLNDDRLLGIIGEAANRVPRR